MCKSSNTVDVQVDVEDADESDPHGQAHGKRHYEETTCTGARFINTGKGTGNTNTWYENPLATESDQKVAIYIENEDVVVSTGSPWLTSVICEPTVIAESTGKMMLIAESTGNK